LHVAQSTEVTELIGPILHTARHK